jgi:hypothetical protein
LDVRTGTGRAWRRAVEERTWPRWPAGERCKRDAPGWAKFSDLPPAPAGASIEPARANDEHDSREENWNSPDAGEGEVVTRFGVAERELDRRCRSCLRRYLVKPRRSRVIATAARPRSGVAPSGVAPSGVAAKGVAASQSA